MKVLLVNAPTPGYELQPYPPLQLGYLAAVARETKRHEVEILDLGVISMTEEEILKTMVNYHVVGVYFVTMNYKVGLHLCTLAKSLGLTTVSGGPHAGLNPKEILEGGAIDFICIGEAETSFVELLDTLEAGESAQRIKGIAFMHENVVVQTPLRSNKSDLAQLSWPARDLLPMSAYRKRTNDSSVLASRGCSYSCKFCAIRLMNNRQYRNRPSTDVIKEAHHVIKNYNFERITFFDDIFTINPQYTLSLCSEIQSQRLNFSWSCETRVDCVNSELLNRMSKAGCYRIFYGVESGSQRVLDSIAKGISVEQIRRAIALTKAAHIQPVLSIMVGVPEDDERSIRETISLVKALDAHQVWFQPFCPFPGTDIVGNIPDLLDDDWSNLYDGFDLRRPVIRTRHLSLEQVRALYMEALLSVADRGWIKPQATDRQ